MLTRLESSAWDVMTLVSLSRGQRLYRAGEVPDAVYVLQQGQIDELSDVGPHRAGLLSLVAPGEWLGDVALLTERPHRDTAVAAADSTLLRLEAADLDGLLTRRPDLTLELARHLAVRTRRAEDRQLALTFSDVRTRLAGELLDLAHRFGRPHRHGVLIDAVLPQRDLALVLGAARSPTNKALADFARRGWIELDLGRTIVRDPAGLAARLR